MTKSHPAAGRRPPKTTGSLPPVTETAAPGSAARLLASVLLLGLAVIAWVYIGGAWRRSRPLRRHLNAGIQFASQGLGPQAEAEWKEAVRLDPNYAPAYRLLAEYYLSAHHWPKALAALERLRKTAPDEEHLDCRLAACRLNLGDQVGAFRHSEAEVKRDPECVPALAASAFLLMEMGEKTRAASYLRKLSRLEPDDPVLNYMLAEALTDTFNYGEARPVLERVIRLDPEHAEAYTLLGIGWIDDTSAPDHHRRAEQALRKSLELNPLNPEARLALGRLYLKQSRPREAILQLEEAARLMPHNSRPAFELARAYDLTGDSARSAAMRRRFLSLRQLFSEVSALEKRASADPTNFDNWYRLGQLELRRADYGRAYVWLQKARSLRPKDPRVTNAMAELSRRSAAPARLAAMQERVAGVSGSTGRHGDTEK
jgi:tetratricopeptide (TPR) repeat protein